MEPQEGLQALMRYFEAIPALERPLVLPAGNAAALLDLSRVFEHPFALRAARRALHSYRTAQNSREKMWLRTRFDVSRRVLWVERAGLDSSIAVLQDLERVLTLGSVQERCGDLEKAVAESYGRDAEAAERRRRLSERCSVAYAVKVLLSQGPAFKVLLDLDGGVPPATTPEEAAKQMTELLAKGESERAKGKPEDEAKGHEEVDGDMGEEEGEDEDGGEAEGEGGAEAEAEAEAEDEDEDEDEDGDGTNGANGEPTEAPKSAAHQGRKRGKKERRSTAAAGAEKQKKSKKRRMKKKSD